MYYTASVMAAIDCVIFTVLRLLPDFATWILTKSMFGTSSSMMCADCPKTTMNRKLQHASTCRSVCTAFFHLQFYQRLSFDSKTWQWPSFLLSQYLTTVIYPWPKISPQISHILTPVSSAGKFDTLKSLKISTEKWKNSASLNFYFTKIEWPWWR